MKVSVVDNTTGWTFPLRRQNVTQRDYYFFGKLRTHDAWVFDHYISFDAIFVETDDGLTYLVDPEFNPSHVGPGDFLKHHDLTIALPR